MSKVWKDIYYLNNVFRESYNVNPKKTLHNMEMCLLELGYEVDNMKLKKIKLFLSKEINQLIMLILLYILVGLFFSYEFPAFLFGLLFFMAGLFINFSSDRVKISLVFLFAHGLIGLIFVIGSFIPSFNTLAVNVNLDKIIIFTVLGIAFCFVGLIRTVLYVLSDDYYKKPYAKCRVFAYYLIGILIIGISSFIFRM